MYVKLIRFSGTIKHGDVRDAGVEGATDLKGVRASELNRGVLSSSNAGLISMQAVRFCHAYCVFFLHSFHAVEIACLADAGFGLLS